MQRTGVVVAVLVMAVGAVFVGQGLGIIRNRSFMVDDPTWAVIGALMVVAGGAFLVRAWSRSRR